ncbi:uncharacterized protein PV07_03799 [Cladophialophora immunda]|uniref:Uncharacterized protein n=1 Tax=Cladophialophora immunda TaxID=569365 RepID=A0A0D2D931_9EURO|nr:uncharacterized protein PV07_03799 [Cladophialophora immunda]KIW32239.1 hypothetical protein PV07_03799 [Cladophialophora immunda]
MATQTFCIAPALLDLSQGQLVGHIQNEHNGIDSRRAVIKQGSMDRECPGDIIVPWGSPQSCAEDKEAFPASEAEIKITATTLSEPALPHISSADEVKAEATDQQDVGQRLSTRDLLHTLLSATTVTHNECNLLQELMPEQTTSDVLSKTWTPESKSCLGSNNMQSQKHRRFQADRHRLKPKPLRCRGKKAFPLAQQNFGGKDNPRKYEWYLPRAVFETSAVL